MTVVLLAGCDDVQLNLGEARATPIRPAGHPLPPPAASAPASSPDKQATSPGPDHTQSAYQVVLLNGPGPNESPAGMRHIRLQHAAPDAVGRWLGTICMPSGGTGTSRRYTLIYPTAAEARSAAGLAVDLDVPPADPPVVPPAIRALHEALRTLYRPDGELAGQLAGRRQAALSLQGVATNGSLPARQRWLAGMMAGAVLRDDGRDTAASRQCFEAAEATAEPGSYEQMACLYAKARLLIQEGDKAAARTQLRDIIAQFGAYRQSEVFERARETFGALGANR